jgi:hypothetical protein
MPQFLTELTITRTVGVKPIVYTLAQDLIYVSDIFGTIVVPAGFKTDFASVPRLLWMIISPIDEHGKAAVVHDYCYYIAYDKKKRCDDIFREGLIVLRVPKWKVVCMYWSVRIFGWVAWLKHRIKRG